MTPPGELRVSRGRGLFKLLAILIITLNLRGAITSVGPLLQEIQAQFGLGGAAAGLLTSLPLFAFGLLSPYAATLARRLGMEMAIFVSLLLLVAGLGLRCIDGTAWLYLGTAFIGCGIAFNNVLLPALLRRDFAAQLTLVTALFTMVLVTCGGLGSGIAIPMAEWGGWRFSLAWWLIPALVAVLVWAPQLRARSRTVVPPQLRVRMWNQSLAWQVSLFMGCQSTAFYVMIAWFPSIMADLEGVSPARSGWILFIYQIFVLIAVMAVPWLIHRLPDQRWIGTGCAVLILTGYGGLLLATQYA
ncbi:MAG TPA: MFS transporter, partial [Steroidobacteraceae bacterium]|nr:MFS transporter [Steroidobacteraceae bacterium]